jgi:hypothetical protein
MNRRHWVLILAASVVAASAPAVAAEKPWTAMFIYGDHTFVVKEDLKYERTCREAICQFKDGMSCAERDEAARKRKEAAEKANAEREAKIAQYRLTQPCKIVEAVNGKDGKPEWPAASRLHCPLPDGGERIYDKDGEKLFDTVIGSASGTFVSSGLSYLSRAICFQ